MSLQTATGKQLSIARHLTGVWQKEGLKSLFAGNGANCIRVLPFSALVCVAYSNMAKVRLVISKKILDSLMTTKFNFHEFQLFTGFFKLCIIEYTTIFEQSMKYFLPYSRMYLINYHVFQSVASGVWILHGCTLSVNNFFKIPITNIKINVK